MCLRLDYQADLPATSDHSILSNRKVKPVH